MDFPSLLAAADRAALGLLGGVARYASATGTEVDVRVIFDNADGNATVQGQEVVSAGPRVFVRLADLPHDPQQEPSGYPRLTIGGIPYVAREVREDGMGGATFELSKAVA